jgi:hypothetical protein
MTSAGNTSSWVKTVRVARAPRQAAGVGHADPPPGFPALCSPAPVSRTAAGTVPGAAQR